MNDEQRLVFVDTNIPDCAYDHTTGQKHVQARALLEDLWNQARGRHDPVECPADELQSGVV
jgi:hypothetical protein